VLLELALAWIAAAQPSDFVGARVLLEILRDQRPNDRFVIHQLALATYKSEQPTPLDALKAARDQLSPLRPETTNNPETLSLWGAIHRRMWDLEKRPEQLAEAVHAYSRSFYVKQDAHSGLIVARLLELRALQSARAGGRDEAIADRVLARRVRQDILRYVAPQLDDLDELRADKRYWMLASLWEVNAGLGRGADATRWEQEARAVAPASAMVQTTEQHIARTHETQAALDATLAAAV
jgi:hypothetical protein